MQHECKITVIDKKCFTDYQEQYLADPKSGPCPFFNVGDEFILKRTPQQDDFYHLMNGKFCGEAWDAISRYVYTALQGGSIMKGWKHLRKRGTVLFLLFWLQPKERSHLWMRMDVLVPVEQLVLASVMDSPA